jgi:hypothetical protein
MAVLHPLMTRCPVCSAPTFIERLRCTECHTAVEGRFSADWMQALTPEQLGFVRVFVTCRGKIKDVEEALGVSYPTVVSRLDEIAEAIAGAPQPAVSPDHASHRKEILDALAAGTISAEEAAKRLRRS